MLNMIQKPLTRRHLIVAAVMSAATAAWQRGGRPASAGAAVPAGAAGTLTIGADLPVNRMGFGAMRITGMGIWGEPKDPKEARAVLRRAIELGVNFIDTADAYGPDVSERLICEVLHPYPKDLIIATKGGLTRPGPSEWVANGTPKHLREACVQSLKRLKLERIDLYQLHAIDSKVPLEDSLGELARLQQEGKIRHIGVSNFKLDELQRAQRIVPVASVQNRYNVVDRSSEDVLQYCAREHIAFIPWAPLARGTPEARSGKAEGEAFKKIAADHAVTDLQLAIAWLLAKSPTMLPIPGTSSVAHLEENVAAARIGLTPKELAAIG
jgi:aryl-alcohol dehydrogenase-like predicted oxidoreductase